MISRLCKGHSTHFTSGTIRLAPFFIISPKAGLRSSGDVLCDPRPLVLEAELHATSAVLQITLGNRMHSGGFQVFLW